MRRHAAATALLLWLSLFLPPPGGDMCLPSPESVLCPTCPSLLRCYDLTDWFDFFLPGWDGLR